LDFYFGTIQPYERGNRNQQFKKISMENHEWMDNGGIENTHLRSGSKGIPRKSQKRQFQ